MDAAEGVRLSEPQLSQVVVSLPIAARLRERLGVPAARRNGAQIAVPGKMAFGAGKDAENVVRGVPGPGVGGAIVRAVHRRWPLGRLATSVISWRCRSRRRGRRWRHGDPLRRASEGHRSHIELTVEVVREAGRFLGLWINLLNPGRIELDGGIVEAVDPLFDVASFNTRRETSSTPGCPVEIVRAGLGDAAGSAGTALAAA
ncbi:MAG: ROK family protein [Thermomicrobiales bacterium]|nr:ROK family protein [Thermomicrobiales bacterium]